MTTLSIFGLTVKTFDRTHQKTTKKFRFSSASSSASPDHLLKTLSENIQRQGREVLYKTEESYNSSSSSLTTTQMVYFDRKSFPLLFLFAFFFQGSHGQYGCGLYGPTQWLNPPDLVTGIMANMGSPLSKVRFSPLPSSLLAPTSSLLTSLYLLP
jgi:hypothetical protein